jgi:hypothetical protein
VLRKWSERVSGREVECREEVRTCKSSCLDLSGKLANLGRQKEEETETAWTLDETEEMKGNSWSISSYIYTLSTKKSIASFFTNSHQR